MIEIKKTNTEDENFLALVKILDAELRVRDGEEQDFYAQFNKPVGLGGVVIAYLENVPVPCGAFKKYSEATAEIKRMFVSPEVRGQRIGGAILGELESWAAELNFYECILETGFKQPEAIALYKRSGYEVISNYGQYSGIENSVCMRKSLT